MNKKLKKAVTKVQAAIVAVIIAVVVIAGAAAYYLSLPAPSPAPAPTPTPTPSPTPTLTPIPSPAVIKIGFHCPLSGPLADVGLEAKQGAELAVKFINENGGVNGKQIELIVYDDRGDTSEAVTIARKLIEKDKVLAVVSGSVSATTRAAAPIFQENGVPYVSAYATHPEITATGKYVVATSIRSEVHGRTAAWICKEKLGAKRVSLLVVDNDYGRTVAKGFKEMAQSLGLTIVSEDVYSLPEKEFRPILTKIKELNTDAIFDTGYPWNAAQICIQAEEIGLEVQIIGQEAYDHPKTFFGVVGDAAEGVIITTALNRDDKRELVQKYIKTYTELYGMAPGMVDASCFDAVQVLAYGIEQGGENREAIINAMLGLENFNAITGPFINFTEEGHVVKPVHVQIVHNQEFHYYYDMTNPDVITP